MKNNTHPNLSLKMGKSWWKALLVALPMFVLTAVMLFGGMLPQDKLHAAISVFCWFFYNLCFLLMMKTGRTDDYRACLFTIIAVGFVFSFFYNIIELRGNAELTMANMVEGKTPFCHIAIPFVLIPAALTRTIIFPGHLLGGFASIASMIVIWVGACLTMGRGWCSWACFYGGWDDRFARFAKKPLIPEIDRRWRFMPYAVLVTVALLSAATLSPVYCGWLCPFKAVTESPKISSWLGVFQAVTFYTLFFGLAIVLPILTRRRTQCGLFCPFGAMQSLINKINIFEVRIDREKCVDCGKCIKNCPTLSLDESTVKAGRTCLTCTKCGRCIDLCPRGAINYHIKGTPLHIKTERARILFLYTAFLFMYIFTNGMVSKGVWLIFKLITTGHFA